MLPTVHTSVFAFSFEQAKETISRDFPLFPNIDMARVKLENAFFWIARSKNVFQLRVLLYAIIKFIIVSISFKSVFSAFLKGRAVRELLQKLRAMKSLILYHSKAPIIGIAFNTSQLLSALHAFFVLVPVRSPKGWGVFSPVHFSAFMQILAMEKFDVWCLLKSSFTGVQIASNGTGRSATLVWGGESTICTHW